MTVFLTTQYLEEADRLADRVAVLDGGRVVAEGTPAELKRRVADQRLDLVLADADAFAAAARLLDARALAADPRRRGSTSPPTAAPRTCARCSTRSTPTAAPCAASRVHSATLDDVFLALTGHPRPNRDRRCLTPPSPWPGAASASRCAQLDALLTSLLLPVLLMLIFVYLFGGAIETGTDYVTYVVPGVILLCAGFGSATTAVTVSQDMSRRHRRPLPLDGRRRAVGARRPRRGERAAQRGLDRARARRRAADRLPPRRRAARLARRRRRPARVRLAMSSLAAALGLLAGSPEAANGFTFLILFLPYASSAFVPVDTMPTWLQGFAEHQPVTPVIETLRGLLLGTPTARGVDGARVVRGDPRGVARRVGRAVPAPHELERLDDGAAHVRLAGAELDAVDQHAAVGGDLLARRAVIAVLGEEAPGEALIERVYRAAGEVGRPGGARAAQRVRVALGLMGGAAAVRAHGSEDRGRE